VRDRDGEWELHNLSKDKTETINLAGKMPEKAAQLSALWEARFTKSEKSEN
jgi:hypothetical protein